MGGPTEPEDDRGESLPPPHAGQRSEIHDAHGVHPGGQTGFAAGPFALPPASLPAGEGDEQSPGPASGRVLGGAANAIPVSPRSGGRTQVTALPPETAEVPVCHHRVAAGGFVASRNPPHHAQTRRW